MAVTPRTAHWRSSSSGDVGHVYPSLPGFKRFLTGGTYGDARDAELLTLLESASRAVDGWCRRGSGFGPVVETRTFTTRGRRLSLQGDLSAIDSVELDGTAMDPADYAQPDPRHLVAMGFGYGKTAEITGAWSYPFQVIGTGATLSDDPLAIDAEEVTPSDLTVLSVAQTLLIEDEQLLVTAIGETTATVVRGVNGTTAAAHVQTTPIQTYRYAAEAVDGSLRIAQRRWKARDAGLTPLYDGQGIPGTANQDTEASILRMAVGHLRFAFVR